MYLHRGKDRQNSTIHLQWQQSRAADTIYAPDEAGA